MTSLLYFLDPLNIFSILSFPWLSYLLTATRSNVRRTTKLRRNLGKRILSFHEAECILVFTFWSQKQKLRWYVLTPSPLLILLSWIILILFFFTLQREKLMQIILSKKPNLEVQEAQHMATPLYMAVENNCVEAVDLLIQVITERIVMCWACMFNFTCYRVLFTFIIGKS